MLDQVMISCFAAKLSPLYYKVVLVLVILNKVQVEIILAENQELIIRCSINVEQIYDIVTNNYCELTGLGDPCFFTFDASFGSNYPTSVCMLRDARVI